MPDHAGDRGAAWMVLAPHDHLHIKQIRATPVRPAASIYGQTQGLGPRQMGACAPLPSARRRTWTAARRKAQPADGVPTGPLQGHAHRAGVGGAPSGFSRIQIASCEGCWPASPRPPGSHLPFHTTAVGPSAAGSKALEC
jgi:hypothetical protein